jgi:glycosyltransferase involved in cell wall biosynthesis
MKNKNILMVAYSEYSRDARIRREAEALTEIGYNVDFFVLKEKQSPLVDTSVNLIHLNLEQYRGNSNLNYILSYFNFFFQSFMKILWLYPKKRYKIIYTHNMPDFIVFLGLIPKLFGCKLIHDIHDLMPDIYKSKFKSAFANIIYYLLLIQEKISCMLADKIITVSDIALDILINDHKLRKEKISVVRNFADKDIFTPMKLNTNRNNDLNLIHHGTISDRFGLRYIIKEMETICKEYSHVKLHFYGKGDGKEEVILAKMINESKLTKNVFLHGQIQLDDIPRKISAADIGIVSYKKDPSTDIFTPLKLLEYIAMEKPIVTVHTKAIAMLIKDAKLLYYENGLEESFSNAIFSLITNEGKLDSLTKETIKLNNQINWGKEKKILQNVVVNLCQ